MGVVSEDHFLTKTARLDWKMRSLLENCKKHMLQFDSKEVISSLSITQPQCDIHRCLINEPMHRFLFVRKETSISFLPKSPCSCCPSCTSFSFGVLFHIMKDKIEKHTRDIAITSRF
ncbi:uncharacterized protein LOC144547471 isoform X2 [Carex rostrata]